MTRIGRQHGPQRVVGTVRSSALHFGTLAHLAALAIVLVVGVLVASPASALEFRYHGTITEIVCAPSAPCWEPTLFDVGSDWSIFLPEAGPVEVTLGGYSYFASAGMHLNLSDTPAQGADLFVIDGFEALFGTDPVNGALPDVGALIFADDSASVFGPPPIVLLEPPDPRDFDSVQFSLMFSGMQNGFIVSSDNAALPEPRALALLGMATLVLPGMLRRSRR